MIKTTNTANYFVNITTEIFIMSSPQRGGADFGTDLNKESS